MCTFVCTQRRNHVCTCLGGTWFLCSCNHEIWARTSHFLNPFSSQCLCTTWLDPKALALLPGFCIAASLLPVLKTWLSQGLPWLLPWMPKPDAPKRCLGCTFFHWAHAPRNKVWKHHVPALMSWCLTILLCDTEAPVKGGTAGKQHTPSVNVRTALNSCALPGSTWTSLSDFGFWCCNDDVCARTLCF